MAFALFPIAHSFDRHFDFFGERRLRQSAARPDLPNELCRIAVVKGLLSAVRKDFDDPPVGFQSHPHHGRDPQY
jgi:hypothetical protein